MLVSRILSGHYFCIGFLYSIEPDCLTRFLEPSMTNAARRHDGRLIHQAQDFRMQACESFLLFLAASTDKVFRGGVLGRWRLMILRSHNHRVHASNGFNTCWNCNLPGAVVCKHSMYCMIAVPAAKTVGIVVCRIRSFDGIVSNEPLGDSMSKLFASSSFLIIRDQLS